MEPWAFLVESLVIMSFRPLSFDHKPMDTKERARIESAGGFVEFNRFSSHGQFSKLDFLFNQSQWEFGIVACNGGLRVQDE